VPTPLQSRSAIPPELLSTRPRQIVRRTARLTPRLTYSLIALVVLSFITGVRIAFAGMVDHAPLVNGTITAKATVQHLWTSYSLDYSYPLNKATLNDSQQVSLRNYNSLDVGMPAPVRAIALGGLHYSQLAYADDIRIWWPIWIFAIPIAVAAIFFYFADWIGPRDLVRYGEVVLGHITAVTPLTARGKLIGWTVSYEFVPPRSGSLPGVMTFRADRFAAGDIQPGTRVTVVYNPAHPERNLAYELSEFTARRTAFAVVHESQEI
jgi:hypothetical protein